MFVLHIGFIVALINFLPDFAVEAFSFQGANIYGVIVPQYYFNETLTIVLIAIIITFLQKIFDYIFD